MTRRVIHAGARFTVGRSEPGTTIDIYDRVDGNQVILSWGDLVAMVADLQEHIAAQQSAEVTERPSAADVARERWRL